MRLMKERQGSQRCEGNPMQEPPKDPLSRKQSMLCLLRHSEHLEVGGRVKGAAKRRDAQARPERERLQSLGRSEEMNQTSNAERHRRTRRAIYTITRTSVEDNEIG